MFRLQVTDSIPTPVWLADVGNINTMPRPWQQITEEQFWQTFVAHVPQYAELRQVRGKDRMLRPVQLFWFLDRAVAVALPVAVTEPIPPTNYYRIGCLHKEWRTLSAKKSDTRGIPHLGASYIVRECRTCGYIDGADTVHAPAPSDVGILPQDSLI